MVIPVLLGVTVVVFLALHLAPGDPAQWLLGPTATPETLAKLRAELGIDQAIPVQYWHWITDLLHGKFGY